MKAVLHEQFKQTPYKTEYHRPQCITEWPIAVYHARGQGLIRTKAAWGGKKSNPLFKRTVRG